MKEFKKKDLIYLIQLLRTPGKVIRRNTYPEHVVSDSEDVQEASKEWADPVAARTGPFGAASDIPCEVWGDEFDSVNAAKTIRLIGRFRSCRSPAIPGVKPQAK